MEAPKLKHSDAVSKRVDIAMKFGGKANKIDHKDDYAELQRLLSDIQAGKVDKNMIEEDAMYVRGLCMEYEKRYLGEQQGYGEATSSQNSNQEEITDKNSKQEKVTPQPQPQPQAEAGGGVQPPVQKPVEKQKKNPFEKPDKPIKKPEFPQPGKEKPIDKKTQPPVTPPPHVKSRNSGNNVAGEKAVVVTGDNNTVIINGKEQTDNPKEVVPTSPTTPASNKKKTSKKMTKEEMLNKSLDNYSTAAREGARVAEFLIGPTSEKEKTNAIRMIMRQNPGTIMGFIDGFNRNDTIAGIKYGVGGIVDQIDNENGWTTSEKQTVLKHIIMSTLQWALTCHYGEDPNYKELHNIYNHLNAGHKIDTERADELIKELISKGKVESGV